MYERSQKTMKLRFDYYAVAFMGYVYLDDDQRMEIVLDTELELISNEN